MRNQKLHCLLVGRSTNFSELIRVLSASSANVRLSEVVRTKKHAIAALKAIRGPSIAFVSDEALFPLNLLANLIQTYNPSTIVVVVTQKTASIPLKKLYKGTEFTKLNIKNTTISNDAVMPLHLSNIIQIAQSKQQFRQCKSLLANAEQCNTWLVDSSHESVAYISKDFHLYANTAYLALFDIESMQALRSLSIKDLIVSDEVGLFDAFLKYQTKHYKLSHTLLLSMRDTAKNDFRASIHVTPSVFKGKQSWQLWVHRISQSKTVKGRNNTLKKEAFPLIVTQKLSSAKNPFDELNKELSDKKKKADANLILKGIIKREDANLSALKLTSLSSHLNQQDVYPSHYILSLKVPVAQRKAVDDLLSRSFTKNTDNKRQIFWDKLTVFRLTQLLLRTTKLKDNYLLPLTKASTSDPEFTQWMLKNLHLLGAKSRNLTIMIPSQLENKDVKRTIDFVNNLKKHHCNVALNDFTSESNILKILRFIKPNFVRLSLEWLRQVESDEKRKNSLSSLLRQFETKNIQVIAPCSFSMEMRTLFVFSGVSFCQERTTKTA